jgi:hypothetical protein
VHEALMLLVRVRERIEVIHVRDIRRRSVAVVLEQRVFMSAVARLASHRHLVDAFLDLHQRRQAVHVAARVPRALYLGLHGRNERHRVAVRDIFSPGLLDEVGRVLSRPPVRADNMDDKSWSHG